MALKDHVKMLVTLLVHIHNDITTLLVQDEIVLCPTRKDLRETFLRHFRLISGQTLLQLTRLRHKNRLERAKRSRNTREFREVWYARYARDLRNSRKVWYWDLWNSGNVWYGRNLWNSWDGWDIRERARW